MQPASWIPLHHIGTTHPNAPHRGIFLYNELSLIVSACQHRTSCQCYLQVSICLLTFQRPNHASWGKTSCQFRKWACHSTDRRDESLVITSKEKPHIRLSLGPLKSPKSCHFCLFQFYHPISYNMAKNVTTFYTRLKFPDRSSLSFPPFSNTSAPQSHDLVALPILALNPNFFCVGRGVLL